MLYILVLLIRRNEMTKKNTGELYLLFSSTDLQEVLVEFSDPELLVLAELIADTSTLRDRKEFLRRWPGHNGSEPFTQGYDEYAQGLSAKEERVLAFAQTHNLTAEVIEM